LDLRSESGRGFVMGWCKCLEWKCHGIVREKIRLGRFTILGRRGDRPAIMDLG
jgi:hypothetical protein